MKLLSLVSLLIPALAAAEGAPAAAPAVSPFIPLIVIFGIFYFLVLRPQQKKAKEHQKFLTGVKKGDMIITHAGIIGTIKTVSEKFVNLEVDKGVCLKILKSQILESADSLKDKEPTKKGSLAQAQS